MALTRPSAAPVSTQLTWPSPTILAWITRASVSPKQALGVARTVGRELHLLRQARPSRTDAERTVELDGGGWRHAAPDLHGEPLEQEVVEPLQVRLGQGHAGRHAMPAALLQQTLLACRDHGRTQIEPADRPGGALGDAIGEAQHHDRPMVPAVSRLATMPTMPGRQPAPAASSSGNPALERLDGRWAASSTPRSIA